MLSYLSLIEELLQNLYIDHRQVLISIILRYQMHILIIFKLVLVNF